MSDILNKTKEFKVKDKKRRRWYKIVSALASVVVFCTVYALILPAITMEQDPVCGFEEHIHGDLCYGEKLICGYDDPDDEHAAAKSDVETDTSAADDTSVSTDVVDNMAESDCYYDAAQDQSEPAATSYDTETVDSVSDSERRTMETEAHVHTEECYKTVITCKKIEHTHERKCYLKKNIDSNFTVDGKKINGAYTWSDEDGLLAFDVVFHGDAVTDSGLSAGAEPELKVELNSEESFTFGCEQEIESYPLVNFRLSLNSDGQKIDLSKCMADVTVSVNNELVSAAVPMAVGGKEAEWASGLVLTVFNDEKESVAETDFSEDSPAVMTFSTRANGTSAIEIQPNPSFVIQHYLSDFPMIVTTSSPDNYPGISGERPMNLPFINASQNVPNADVATINGGTKRTSNLVLNNGTGTNSPNNQKIFYVPLDRTTNGSVLNGGAEMLTEEVYRKLFIDELTDYRHNPQINYMNRLYKGKDVGEYNQNYTLSEIWVYQPKSDFDISASDQSAFEQQFGAKFTELDYNDTDSYDAPLIVQVPALAGDALRHNPELVRFTNNPSNGHISKQGESTTRTVDGKNITGTLLTKDTATDAYPYEYTVLIKKNTVVRLVFDTTEDPNHEHDVNFFDYDISDGFIYSASDSTTKINTSEQSKNPNNTYFAKTNQQGINSAGNYIGSGAKYAFGNGNTGNSTAAEEWNGNGLNGNKLNQANRPSYKFCTFGLVSSLTYGANGLPVPSWSNGVIAPDLFSAADSKNAGADGKTVAGKTSYLTYTDSTGEEKSRYSLGFEREGGTYTLSYVKDNINDSPAVDNLTKFIHPKSSAGTEGNLIVPNTPSTNKYYPHIYTNEFWPMDGSDSHGTDGHDLKFGDRSKNGYRRYDINSNFPLSDNEGYDHNSYFGMSLTVDFSVEPGYCSPLAYWFYGDDDMWVFLSEVITDPDGTERIDVDSAVLVADIGGVHSAVGEYVNLWEYIDPVGFDDPAQKYRLTIFYTERGASGSTCYMRMTIPLAAHSVEPPDREDEIVIEKVLRDEEGNVILHDDPRNDENFAFQLTLTAEDGIVYEDIYDATIYERTGAGHGISGTVIRKRPLGLSNPESGIYEFMLKGSEYIVISGLPPGTKYEIAEVGIQVMTTDENGNEVPEHNDDGSRKYVKDNEHVTMYQMGKHEHIKSNDPNNPETVEEYLGSATRYSVWVPGESSRQLEADGSYKVVDNYVCFTNAPAIKTELRLTDEHTVLSPGDKEGVHLGYTPDQCGEIVYIIEWANDSGDDAHVVVTDTLDIGLDLVAVKFGGGADSNGAPLADTEWHELNEANGYTYTEANGNTISYSDRTVKWDMPEKQTGEYGIVAMKARVNLNALNGNKDGNVIDWHVIGDYKNNIPYDDFSGIVANTAYIDVGTKHLTTNTVENPTWIPIKTEVTPGQGQVVLPNNEITYRVTWKNYMIGASDVIVRDPLDDKVTYKNSTAKVVFRDGRELSADEFSFNADDQYGNGITWTIPGVNPGDEGYVEFTVTVNENAPVETLWNWAYVKIGHTPELETNHIDNPLYIYELPSTGGIGTTVFIVTGIALMIGSLFAGCLIRCKRKGGKL